MSRVTVLCNFINNQPLLKDVQMNDLIKKQLFGTLGIESADVDLSNVTEEDLPEKNIEEESSVAEAIEDVDLDTEVGELENQGEDLEDAAENLEELDVAVESHCVNGGTLTPIEAAALKLSIAQATSRFVKDTSSLVPAIESFKNDPDTNTRLARESLKETAKTFADSVVEFAKKALERLKEIFNNFINRFRGIEARANKVIVAAKTIKGDIQGEITFPKDKISVNGSVEFAEIKDGFGRLENFLSKLKDAKSLEAISNITSELNNLNEGKGTITTEQIFDAQNKFMDASFRDLHGDVTEDGKNLVSKNYPGEFRALLVREEGISLSYEAFEKVKAENKNGDAAIQAIQPTEIIALATAIKSIQKDIADFKGLPKRIVQMFERLNTIQVSDTSRLEDPTEVRKNDKERAKKLGNALWKAMGKQTTYYSKIVSGANDISGNILTLCEKSIALAKKPQGEEKADEKTKQKQEQTTEEKTA